MADKGGDLLSVKHVVHVAKRFGPKRAFFSCTRVQNRTCSFGAETFCLLVKSVPRAQQIPPLSMSRRGNESLFYHGGGVLYAVIQTEGSATPEQ